MERKPYSVSIDDELMAEVARYAKRNKMKRNDAVEQLLWIALEDKTAADHVAVLETNLRKAYALLDAIMEQIEGTGYVKRKELARRARKKG